LRTSDSRIARQDEARAEIRSGVRSENWDFSRIVARARHERREDVEWLERLADVVAGRAEASVLDGWDAWNARGEEDTTPR
jgi:hypothetical protein